jgi:HSP20 family protein
MFLVPLTRNANDISRSFDKLFDDGFFDRLLAPATTTGEPGTRSPALDVAETDREYTVTLDMPGITKDDVQVAIDGRRVSIEARTRTDEEKKDGDRLIYRERASTRYARSFTLPQEVDQTASSAKLDHGVLKLTLAKRSATTAARLQVN